MPPKKPSNKEIIGIMVNKIFFKGGLKVKDNPETKKNARDLVSLLTYIKKNVNVNKPGTIKWFIDQKVDNVYFVYINGQSTEQQKKKFTKAQGILQKLNKRYTQY